MATLEAINIEANAHMDRIESFFHEHVSHDLTPVIRIHKNRDILRRLQLSYIADMLERLPIDGGASNDPRLAQALALIESGAWTKSQMEAVLLGEDDDS